MKKYIFTLFIVLIFISVSPMIAEASWWNPISWFKKSTPITPVVNMVKNVSSQNKGDIKKIPDKENVNSIVLSLSLAQCLKDKGAVFYGAFWCPHCQKQKALFGDSVKYLPYVECSTPDGKNQTEVCKNNNITGYPTWKFKDGTELTGEVSFENLANKTGCTNSK